jgi:hemerythrin-like domain-containing protein
MKRHPALREFSDDHHQGLVRALRLRRAAGGEGASEEVAAEFVDFWRADTRLHFRKEEEVLLPVLVRHGLKVEQEPLVEMLLQHARIRALALRMEEELSRGGVRPETLREVGDTLEAHIRLEERVVFPLLEETMPESAMEELARRVEEYVPGG